MPQRISEIKVEGNGTGGNPLLGHPPPAFTPTNLVTTPSIPDPYAQGREWIYSDTPMANEYLDRLVPIGLTRDVAFEERERLRRRLAPIAKSIARRLRG